MNKQHRYLAAIITIISFTLYLGTDAYEFLFEGFSLAQLYLTYLAMALIPFSMFGIYAYYHRKGGLLFLAGTMLIAFSYIYFTGTALYGIVDSYTDYGALVRKLGLLYKFHGVVLIIGSAIACCQMIRKKMFYPACAYLVGLGTLASFITGLLALPETGFMLGNTLRNTGFALSGVYMLMYGDSE